MFPACGPAMEAAAGTVSQGTSYRLWSPASYASLVRAWRRHGYILPSVAIALFVCAWFVTWGDWEFFFPESFCRFYDAQAASLLQGRLDVPAQAIGFEAFVFGGKTYGYYGIAPALLRIPLLILVGDLDGLSSRAMMMTACSINIVCAYGILRAVREKNEPSSSSQPWLHWLFIICAGFGSTNIFLMSRSFVFHEASIWGGAFALAWAWAIIKYLQSGRRSLLIVGGLFAFMAFHSRPTAGAGTLLGFGLLAAVLFSRLVTRRNVTREENRLPMTSVSHLLIALTAVVVTLCVYFAVNYAKFRTFDGIPVRYYQFYVQDPHRMEVTGAKQIHIANIPTAAANYFGWHAFHLRKQFPFLFLNDEATIIGNPALDVTEPFTSVPVSMPELSLFAIAGIVVLWIGRRPEALHARIPALALIAGGSIVLMTVGITERYLHDFYPALIVCGAVGISAIETSRYRREATGLAFVLTLISVYLNCSFALVQQRTARWGVPPQKRAEFVQWQESIDRFFQ